MCVNGERSYLADPCIIDSKAVDDTVRVTRFRSQDSTKSSETSALTWCDPCGALVTWTIAVGNTTMGLQAWSSIMLERHSEEGSSGSDTGVGERVTLDGMNIERIDKESFFK